ncbi:hypothetical protein E3N88_23145 [Mikania micrantha]|uniref:Uncharacterized protein n=1 Tax=Mikania micrantha TaxID=192012 RepID=A0A5N6NCP4_9ASTR|nr:hypothetical protein E3N88_23145 [Mikania micrantha]
MATMKFALVTLTLFVLLKAYNARRLQDVSIEEKFDGQPLFHATTIQMVTADEKLPLPSSLSSHDHTTYGRVNLPPPPPKPAPSKNQATYGRENSAPPPPVDAPSGGQAIYGEDMPSSELDSSQEEAKFGREDPRTPPSPNPNDSKAHGMYGRVIPSAPPPPKPAGPIHPLVSDGGSAWTGLSSSTIDYRTNLDRWHSINAFYRLSTYVTRLFKYLG